MTMIKLNLSHWKTELDHWHSPKGIGWMGGAIDWLADIVAPYEPRATAWPLPTI